MSVGNRKTYDEIEVGESVQLNRTLLESEIDAFAQASGDHNPIHMDPEAAQAAGYQNRIAHGMLLASWVSAALAHELPGTGTVYLKQSLEFRQPALPGDVLTLQLTVAEKRRRGRVVIDCRIVHENGKDVLRGSAEVIAPGS